MKPTKIQKISPSELAITWDTGHEGRFTLEHLRDQCPCAGCQGETVLLHHYSAPPPERSTLGRYDLRTIQPVGSYAIQLGWGDGHNSGIYTWEHLMSCCECEACAQRS